MQGLRRQAARRDVPQGYPRFGYMLDHEGAPVGVLLLIYSLRHADGEPAIHCNLSSWYVEPAFRNYAPMLTKIAQRHKEVTYFNISPAHWTWPIIEAQGFRAYCKGLFFSFPALSRWPATGTAVEIVSADTRPNRRPSGCRRRTAGAACRLWLPQPGLPYREWRLPLRVVADAHSPRLDLAARDAADLLPQCRRLRRLRRRDRPRAAAARQDFGVASMPTGRLPGVAGFYTEKRGRKYFKGPHRPRLADLTDTELVLYGP